MRGGWDLIVVCQMMGELLTCIILSLPAWSQRQRRDALRRVAAIMLKGVVSVT